MTRILILIGIFAAATLAGVSGGGSGIWQPVPETLQGEVDVFFTAYEQALNRRQADAVMALYAADATEERPAAQGGKQGLDGIRQRRVAEMNRYANTGTSAPHVPISALLYQPGGGEGMFRLKYVVRGDAAPALFNANGGEIVYGFRRTTRGLKLVSTDVQPLVVATRASAPKKPAQPRAPLDPKGPPPRELVLNNGAVLRQVEVLGWAPDAMLIRYVGGTVPIRLEHMAPEDRAYFLENMDEAIQRQNAARVAAAQASAANERFQTTIHEMDIQNQAQAAQQEEQRQDEIRRAISKHNLMIGMTKDQVRASWGSPSRTTSVNRGAEGQGALWAYDGRGVDDQGNPTNAGVGFAGDVVISLYSVKNH